jgi:hypothetical protein
MADELLKRYHFLTEDRQTVVTIIDHSLFRALVIVSDIYGAVAYKGSNHPEDKPLEVCDHAPGNKRRAQKKGVIPFQYEFFRGVDS